MQVKTSTDYALRCVLYLSIHQRVATAIEIGKEMHISVNYTRVILQRLKAAGLVSSVQGVTGGYKLFKDPKDITIFDVFAVEEGSMTIYPSVFKKKMTGNDMRSRCFSNVRYFYYEYQELSDNYLKKTTIADILNSPEKLNAVQTSETLEK